MHSCMSPGTASKFGPATKKVFTALWRTGTEDTRCLLHPMWMWPGLHLTYLVCMLALGKRTTTGMCISDILTNCQWLNTFNNDHHIQLENTEIFITKSICMGQLIRQVTGMNLLPSNMNGEVGLFLSNLWNSLFHSQRDCRCPPLRWLICSLSFFRNNIMLLSLFYVQYHPSPSPPLPPPPTKVLVAVLLCSQFQLYLPSMSYLTSSDSSSRPSQGPVLVQKGYFVASLFLREASNSSAT